MAGNKLEYVGTVWIEIFAYGRSKEKSLVNFISTTESRKVMH